MSHVVDITGQKFGKLTAIKRIGSEDGRATWLFKCDCGNEIIRKTHDVKRGIYSCGCYGKEVTKAKFTTHGMTNTRIYRIWKAIKNRCENPNCEPFKNYGGRGIKVCTEWENDFIAFYEWSLANGYAENLTIDRINVNGNYEASNCRWVTKTEQANNKRNNIVIECQGEVKTASEWSKKLGISRTTIVSRYKKGLSAENILYKGNLKGKVNRL